MATVQLAQNEMEYIRKWSDYWLFCLRRRYGNTFLTVLFGGITIATILLTLAHPGEMPATLFSVISIVIALASIVSLFDFFRYRQYVKQLQIFFDEHKDSLSYQLRFDEHRIYFGDADEQGKEWSIYTFYYAHRNDIYLFDKKREIKMLLSQNSIGEDAFNAFSACAKANLRLLK